MIHPARLDVTVRPCGRSWEVVVESIGGDRQPLGQSTSILADRAAVEAFVARLEEQHPDARLIRYDR